MDLGDRGNEIGGGSLAPAEKGKERGWKLSIDEIEMS
jgi:hypothetical protein